ncbi:MAG: hypothetical protein WCH39_17840 [Schlesneria sp.]
MILMRDEGWVLSGGIDRALGQLIGRVCLEAWIMGGDVYRALEHSIRRLRDEGWVRGRGVALALSQSVACRGNSKAQGFRLSIEV